VSPPHRLVGIGKCTKGIVCDLQPGEAVVIGRDADCTIVLTRTPEVDGDFHFISRQHAVIEDERARWCIRDNGSTNGTALLRGGIPPAEALVSGVNHALTADDVIELARSQDFQFVFHQVDGARPQRDTVVDGRTDRLLAAEHACLQLLVGGAAIDVADVHTSAVVLGRHEEGSPRARKMHLAIPGLVVGEVAGTVVPSAGTTRLHVGRVPVRLNLRDLSHGQVVALTDGDLLTFPGLTDASVLFLDPRQIADRNLSDLLADADRITVGTADDNSCRVIHPSLSRHHAEIRRADGALHVRDLQSANGVSVNGIRVRTEQRLVPGDRLSLGRLAYLVDPGCVTTSPALRPSIDVRFVGVSVEIAGKARLRDVSFGLKQGEMLGLLGPSASGKSTLLKALAGQLRVSSGDVYINGRSLIRDRRQRGWLDSLMGFRDDVYDVGFVQQHDLVQPGLTVREILTYAARHMGLDPARAEEQAAQASDLCNLNPLGDRVAQLEDGRLTLSGGQLKRVCVAMEVLRRPRILLLDEPTTGQDPKNTDDLMRLFRSLAQQGVTLLLSTHDLRNLALFDKVAVLCLGRLVYYGPPNGVALHFGAQTAEDVYAALPDKDERLTEAEALEQRFRVTPYFRQFCESVP
jgi:ABC-type multidrug transport system ATPase subunit/pSer/pThr/pTyr-binding forkhead associated (FHA) protein